MKKSWAGNFIHSNVKEMNLPTTMIEKPEKPFYGAEYRDYSQGLNFQFLIKLFLWFLKIPNLMYFKNFKPCSKRFGLRVSCDRSRKSSSRINWWYDRRFRAVSIAKITYITYINNLFNKTEIFKYYNHYYAHKIISVIF